MKATTRLMFGSALLALCVGAATAAPVVVRESVNLRSGPGRGYGVIATMPAGAVVDLQSCQGRWCQVNFGGTMGFASASYLSTPAGPYAYAPLFGPFPVGPLAYQPYPGLPPAGPLAYEPGLMADIGRHNAEMSAFYSSGYAIRPPGVSAGVRAEARESSTPTAEEVSSMHQFYK